MLPQIAQGEANKVWIIPSEVTQALSNLGAAIPKPRSASPRRRTGAGGRGDLLRRTYEALEQRDFAA